MPELHPLLIGVSARIYYPGSQGPLKGVFTKTLHYLEQSVAHWVLSGHAMAVMVPAVTRDSLVLRSDLDLNDYARTLDGLVLQGGNDVAPECYGQQALCPEWAGDTVRDRYEMELINAFVQAGKPVFGICRGLQLINVLFGGSLWQDIATQMPGARAHRELGRYEDHYHEVRFEPGSALARLYPGMDGALTNSIHHQGICQLAPGFGVEARAVEDGLVEAIRRSSGSYVAAVQWHPEFHEAGGARHLDDGALLQDFLQACRSARASPGA